MNDFQPITSLYICYQSVLEPLTQTQVVAYLQGLAAAGHRILLLTYETKPLTADQQRDVKQNLASKGIHEWYYLTYHKRPTLLATLWDMVVGVWCALRLVRKHGVTLVHARSHVPGVIGLWVKKLTGVKLLFDLRGLLAEEYADAGVWSGDGFLFRLTKRMERSLLRNSDEVVVLTESVRRKLLDQMSAGRELRVIPCCVDCVAFQRRLPEKMGQAPVGASPISSQPYMLYVGKLGGWYPTAQMVEFFVAAREVIPNLKWKILTQHTDKDLLLLLARHGLESEVEVASVAPNDLPTAIRGALFALCLYDRKLSAVACSPTKLGEYLAAGVPVIANAGVGDVEQLLAGANGSGNVGIVVMESDPQFYRSAVREMLRLKNDTNVAQRCQNRAMEQLDLCSVGWPRYQKVYQALGI